MSELIHIVRFSRRYATLLLAVGLFCLCTSCSRVQSIRDARTIVATADSLRSAGISLSPFTSHISHFTSHLSHLTSSDSTMLAEAVSALEPVRFFYPTDYAHVNYYYGRLLREAGNQPEAMLAFLRVIHSRTKDYAIKGRAYSNMGSICHLAENYSLSYEMYAKSAEEFLHSGNERAYFYALNDMAYELGTDSLKNQSIQITNRIENECLDSGILTKIWETRANAYLTAKMYDSTLYCICQLQKCGNTEPTGYLFLARAYEGLHNVDSALFYAKKVFNESNYYGDKFNALFILSHYDSTLTSADILSLTSEREDIRYYEYEPGKAKYSEATQLLEQDLSRKPNLTWLWTLLATLCIIATSISIYIRKKKAKHQLISQQVADLQQTRDSLSAQTRQIESEQKLRQEKMLTEIELFCSTITVDNINEELCWRDFDKMCTLVNRRLYGLVDKLKMLGTLNEQEIRLCVLVVTDKFRDKEMAEILVYGENSIRTIKSATAKKIGTEGRKMRSFLLEKSIGK